MNKNLHIAIHFSDNNLINQRNIKIVLLQLINFELSTQAIDIRIFFLLLILKLVARFGESPLLSYWKYEHSQMP